MINKKTVRDVLGLALPAVVEMILYMMVGVLDTMMVGNYGGKIAVSAVGLSSEIIYTFVNILIATSLSVGATSLVARRVGAKKYDSADEYATLSVGIAIVIALLLSLIFFTFPKQIFRLAKAKDEILYLGSIYMKICSIGIFFNMITSVFNAVLRGSGNTKTPLVASTIIILINISLDYLLIFGHFGFPEMGTKGAAIATSIANFTGFIFIVFYTFKKGKVRPKIKYIKDVNKKEFKELLKLAIPSGMQEAAFSICRLINSVMIMILGSVAFSANQITTTIESLSFMPGWGFAVAATTLVGHKIGEKNYEEAKEYADTSLLLGLIVMAFCGLIFLIFPKTLMKLFIRKDEIEVIKLGTACIMIAAIEQVPMGLSMIVGGALKGSGDTKTPFIISVISNWLIRLPLMYYFIYIKRASVTYVWWITTIQWIFDGFLIYMLYRKKFISKVKLKAAEEKL